jgi:long-chain fatty acid transport protein
MEHTGIFAKRPLTIAGSCLICALGSQAQAAGFQLIEQSLSGMGTAYAGAAATAEDASTVYFNPAGLTQLEKPEALAAVHIVVPQADYKDKGSTHASQVYPLPLPATPLGGKIKDEAGVWGAVPNLYYSRPLSNKLFLGLGINVPFGLSTEYSESWVGRYHAVKSELHTVNINPAIAYKINDKVSVGFGINAQYIDAEVTNMIDFGMLIGAPTAFDGKAKLEGDDWSWGYNLGLLFNLTDQTKLGLHYRSKIRHTLEGDAEFTIPAGAALPISILRPGEFVDTDVKSTVTLPATGSVSIAHAVNSKWSVMADISWTDWSQLDELRFEFDSTQADGVTALEWDDSYRYSIGTTYRASDRLTYRAGIALDETPIPNAYYRTPRIPGEDRTWLAIGVGYKYSDRLSFDFGYAYLFVKDPDIEKTPTGNPATDENLSRGYLNGTYDASTDILSAQLRWTFN